MGNTHLYGILLLQLTKKRVNSTTVNPFIGHLFLFEILQNGLKIRMSCNFVIILRILVDFFIIQKSIILVGSGKPASQFPLCSIVDLRNLNNDFLQSDNQR